MQCGVTVRKPEWEFTETNARVFTNLALAMRVVAWIFLIKGLAVHGALSVGTSLLHSHPELVPSEIFGEFAEMFDYLFFAIFLRQAAVDIGQIATSTGSDITNLMRGMAALVAFFKRLQIVGVFLLLKGITTTMGRLSHLASLKDGGVAVQAAASPLPFGLVPPAWSAWCIPLAYLLLTGLTLKVGVKGLRDEEHKIAPYMQRGE